MLDTQTSRSASEYQPCATCPGPGDQAEALLAATSVSEMKEAAEKLRAIASCVRRVFAPQMPTDTSLEADPSVRDPERRRTELADLAVDVVTAVDYLLSLLDTPTSMSPLLLAREAGCDSARGASDEIAADRLTRRRLDARGAAVRLGMRILAGLSCDALCQPIEASILRRESSHCQRRLNFDPFSASEN